MKTITPVKISMIPRKLLDTARTPDNSGELRLYQRGDDFFISFDGKELMNSRMHGSEAVLAELACRPIASRAKARVLVGGLGMGYTLAAALSSLQGDARVIVAELVPAVMKWNRSVLGGLAGHPLDDRRVTVQEHDVCILLKNEQGGFDAVMLDVDNSPDSMTQKSNDWLYSEEGLAVIYMALKPQGVLTVWSAASDNAFTLRLRTAGFTVQKKTVSARGSGKGGRHTIWVATRQC
jgi:spermidine synthase